MRASFLAVVIVLVAFTAIPVGADSWYGGTFEGTGWVLLRIDAFEPTTIRWNAPDTEGYNVLWRTVYYGDGQRIWSGASLHIDPGPGFYLDQGSGAEDVVIAPNPSILSSIVCFMCGGTGFTLGDDYPPGVYYAVVGVGGEVSGWTLDAPRSTLLASGPTHFKWRTDLEGAPFVEVNAAHSSVAAAAGPRSMEFEIEHTLHGVFGEYSGFQHGSATLTAPDGSIMECYCWRPGAVDGGPGTYRYEDDRTTASEFRMPVAMWMDVPLPWT